MLQHVEQTTVTATAIITITTVHKLPRLLSTYIMEATVHSILYTFPHVILTIPYEIGIVVILILEMRTLLLKEVK